MKTKKKVGGLCVDIIRLQHKYALCNKSIIDMFNDEHSDLIKHFENIDEWESQINMNKHEYKRNSAIYRLLEKDYRPEFTFNKHQYRQIIEMYNKFDESKYIYMAKFYYKKNI